jgi:hypothetical protein
MLKRRFFSNSAVFSNLAEPLDDPHGTLGFRGTPVEKHCTKCT